MIDPTNITNYKLTDSELEEHIFFWVLAAGKNGREAARRLEVLLSGLTYNNRSPFTTIKDVYETNEPLPLSDVMKNFGIGCYNLKSKTLYDLSVSELNLRTCLPEDLEKIKGIGMKTARCFIIHSRPDARYAGLDTHMLKHLREKGVSNVPKSTPSSMKEYLRLEKEFLKLSDAAEMSPSSYDLMVWNQYSKGV